MTDEFRTTIDTMTAASSKIEMYLELRTIHQCLVIVFYKPHCGFLLDQALPAIDRIQFLFYL